MLREFCFMKARLKRQYLIQNLKKNALNLVSGFFSYKDTFSEVVFTTNFWRRVLKHCHGIFVLWKHTLRSSIYPRISEDGCLNHCYGIFVLWKHTSRSSIYLQNSEDGCLKHCYRIFVLWKYTSRNSIYLRNSEGGFLKHCYGSFVLWKHTSRSSIYPQNSEKGCLKHFYIGLFFVESKNWTKAEMGLFFFKEKITLKHLKIVGSSDPRVRL